jgi:hypothetical protein
MLSPALLLLALVAGVTLQRSHVYEGKRLRPTGNEGTALDDDGEEVKIPSRLRKRLERREREEGESTSDTPIPDDFPHSDILEENGLETLERVAQIEDFTELDGIGDSEAGQEKADAIKTGLTSAKLNRKPANAE